MQFIDSLVRKLLNQERLQRLSLQKKDLTLDIPLIEFFCEPQWYGVFPAPEMAFKNIPKWWRDIPNDLKPKDVDAGMPMPKDHLGAISMTAKKCLPLLDGMSLGYTLFTPIDIAVRVDKTGKHMEIAQNASYHAASTHSLFQLGGKTSPTYPGEAIKFHNPWVIKTRPGWSTLFIPPINHVEEKRFVCLGAMVDTDRYPKHINFPAIWLIKDFDGVIPAGTPLVTAIPYRRSDVERDVITRVMTESERQEIGRIERVQATRSHYYTQELRESRKVRSDVEKCPMDGFYPVKDKP